MIHVGFKIAAKKGDRYLNALKKHEAVVAKNVTENLFERHMKPLMFDGTKPAKKQARRDIVPA